MNVMDAAEKRTKQASRTKSRGAAKTRKKARSSKPKALSTGLSGNKREREARIDGILEEHAETIRRLGK
jgi:hypothetical protein